MQRQAAGRGEPLQHAAQEYLGGMRPFGRRRRRGRDEIVRLPTARYCAGRRRNAKVRTDRRSRTGRVDVTGGASCGSGVFANCATAGTSPSGACFTAARLSVTGETSSAGPLCGIGPICPGSSENGANAVGPGVVSGTSGARAMFMPGWGRRAPVPWKQGQSRQERGLRPVAAGWIPSLLRQWGVAHLPCRSAGAPGRRFPPGRQALRRVLR